MNLNQESFTTYKALFPVLRTRTTGKHRYVRGLKKTAEDLEAEVLDYRLLEYCANPLNPSGVLMLGKRQQEKDDRTESIKWICPLTGAPLSDHGDLWFAREVGIAYPVLRGIPMLRPEHAIVASGIERT